MENDKIHLYSIGKKYYIHTHEHLTAKQVNALFSACKTAYEMGHPLNRFITIHYDDYADEKRPQTFIKSILEKSRKWLLKRGLPVGYLYVIENGKRKGIHVHLLIHIPPHYQRDYKTALKKWLPFEWTRKRINVQTIKYPDYGVISPLDGIYGNLRYICKSIDPQTPMMGIQPKYQGKIYGRRWGISKSLR